MSTFERFMVTACPWLFGAICIVVGLLIAATDGRTDARIICVVMICSGFILLTLYGIITVLLQMLKALEGLKKEGSAN